MIFYDIFFIFNYIMDAPSPAFDRRSRGLSHGLLPWQGGLAMTRPPPRAAEVRGPGLDRSRVLPGALKLGRFDAVRGVGEVDLV